MEFRKMVMMTLYVRQKKRHKYKDRLLDSVGEGEGGMILENSIETCILSYVKQIPVQVQCMKWHSKPVHWDNPRGWNGEAGRKGI